MKSLIVCVSTSHGNTRRVADRIAEVLNAEVAEPEAVDPEALGDYDLVGFGSGIYYNKVHPRLSGLVGRLPRVDQVAAFTFFTSGAADVPRVGFSEPLSRQLTSKGFTVLDSFCCRGLYTIGPFRFIGGVNKGRPNEADLDRAAGFALRLREHVTVSQTPPD
jgi:flavodoxin